MSEIKFEDFISEEEKKEIVVGEFRNLVRREMAEEKDLKRILSNVSFDVYYNIVDRCFDGKSKEIVKEKVDAILADPTSYNIFKKPDAWDREINSAYRYLQDCIANNKLNIAEKVAELLDSQVVEACKKDVKDLVETVLSEHIRRF